LKLALNFTPQKTDMRVRGSIYAPSSYLFPFLFHVPTLLLSFWFFLLFVCVLWLDQQFWHLRYASVYLSPCCAVHLLPGRRCCLLVVFLLWIKVLFSLDLFLWAIYDMNVNQVWGVISRNLDNSVWWVISYGRFK
jgi:hypothetical protein